MVGVALKVSKKHTHFLNLPTDPQKRWGVWGGESTGQIESIPITLYPIEEFFKYLISLKELEIYSYIEDLFRNCPKLFAFLYITRGQYVSINWLKTTTKKL
jgi:hypothetical protein